MGLPTAYLDTCIISGLAKGDLAEVELGALNKLLVASKRGEISLVTSELTGNEIRAIPESSRRLHETIYNLLCNVPISQHTWTDSGLTLMGVGGGTRIDPLYTKITQIVPGETDAQHLFQAVKSDCHFFITVDNKTILRFSTQIFLELNELLVLSPKQLVELLSVKI